MRSSPIKKQIASFVTATLFLMALVFVFTSSAMAQATTGSIRGSVVDPNGNVVAGAAVSSKNEATGLEKSTVTSGDGTYQITDMLPGKYSVTVGATAGFSSKTVTGVDIRLGEITGLKIDLVVGSATANVTITADTETTIQSDTSQVSASFETRKVQDLPSNAAGNGIDTLALLAPGVVPGFGNVNSDGTTLSVNGNRARANNFTIDGTDNNDLSIGGPSFFVDNQDAVQEYQVITNNFSAQYGRNQGAVVNIVLKSGGNQFHGSGFEFLRNSRTDALTNLERADPTRGRKDRFVSNVFGATIGGPIKKNKAFFFFSAQDIRQFFSNTVNGGSLAPLPSEFAGLLAQYPGNPAIKTFVSQSAFSVTAFGVQIRPRTDTALARQVVCFPKNPLLAVDSAGACGTGANAANDFPVQMALPFFSWKANFVQPEYSVRGDMNVTKKDSFNIRYLWQKSDEFAAQFSNEFLSNVPFKSQNLSGTYNRQINSKVNNEFRATWQKLYVLFGGGCTDTLTGCILDPLTGLQTTFTNIAFSGFGASGGTGVRAIGPATNLPQGRSVEVKQFADNLTWIRGNHSLGFGLDLRFLVSTVPFLPNVNGAFTFGSRATLVANAPTRVTLVGGKDTLNYTEHDKFFYFQDDYKIRNNLTLNLGIRYEYTGQPINVLNQISTARETDPAQALFLQTLPLSARTVPAVAADKNNWAPRVGFAYSPHWSENNKFFKMLLGANDDSVIRGAFSMAYDPAFYNILLNVSTSAPMVFNNTITNVCTNVVPATNCTTNDILANPTFRLPNSPTGDNVRTALGGNLVKNFFDPRLLARTIVSNDFHAPYSEQWSFGVQRQLSRNHVIEVRYVGNRGIGLFQTLNANPFLGADTVASSGTCNGQFTNGGVAHGFCSAGVGGTTFLFPALTAATHGITPLSTAQCPNPVAPLPNGAQNNTAICQGRVVLGAGLMRSRANTATSTYNALQMRANGRLSRQLTYGFSYTYSKTLDNASEIFSFGESFSAADPLNAGSAERSFSGNDRRHAYSSNFIWDVPLGKNKTGFTGVALGGWQINATWLAASGRRYTPEQFFNEAQGLRGYEDISWAGGFAGFDTARPFYGNPSAPTGTVGVTAVDASYVFGMAFPAGTFCATQPCSPSSAAGRQLYSLNQILSNGILVPVSANDVRYIFNGPGASGLSGNPFGNIPRNGEQGPMLNHINAGLFKNIKVRESVSLQLRFDVFNLFNHGDSGYGNTGAGASLPDNIVEDAGANPSATFQNNTQVAHSFRRLQFGVRIIF